MGSLTRAVFVGPTGGSGARLARAGRGLARPVHTGLGGFAWPASPMLGSGASRRLAEFTHGQR